MADGLRQEVSDTKIKITLIAPGMVDTPFFDEPKAAARLRPTTWPGR